MKRLTETASQIKALHPTIKKAVAKLTNQQWKELIRAGLEGEKLTISIARKRDADEGEGPAPKNLDEPLYPTVQNRKVPDWKIEGDWNFNLDAIAQYIQPLVKLNNRIGLIACEPDIQMRKLPAGHNDRESFDPRLSAL